METRKSINKIAEDERQSDENKEEEIEEERMEGEEIMGESAQAQYVMVEGRRYRYVGVTDVNGRNSHVGTIYYYRLLIILAAPCKLQHDQIPGTRCNNCTVEGSVKKT